MRITFVSIGFEQLAISQLSAIAKQDGHEVNLAFSASLFNDRYNLSVPSIAPFFDDRNDVIEAIKKQKPDVLAFSVITGTYQWSLSIAQEAKKLFPHIKTIFGGVHVSAVPDRVLNQPQVDYVCIGEGDVAFPQILRAIDNKEYTTPIINTRYQSPQGQIVRGRQEGFIQDLDSLPIYDKVIWEEHVRIGDRYFTMASRGCPYRCTFCFNNFFAELPEGKKGKYVRQRSVEHMMYELRMAKKRYKLRIVDFQDDVFTVDKKWLKAFLTIYKKEINVPFQCLTHPGYMDEEIAQWLSEAGCVCIQLGVQTVDENFKYESIKRYEKARHVEQALEVMRKYNLHPKVDHMFGLPNEPFEAQEKARQLYVEYTPYRIQTFWTTFLPGTKMLDEVFEMGMLTQEDVDRLNDGLGFDFFRNNHNLQDPKQMKLYKSYEVIFKLLPLFPKFIRKKLSPSVFKFLPAPVCSFIVFTIDACYGIFTRNPDHVAYAKHYLYHLYKFFKGKLGLKKPPATRPNTLEPFLLTPPKKNTPEAQSDSAVINV